MSDETNEQPLIPPAAPEAPLAPPPPPPGPTMEQRFQELERMNQRLAAQNEVLLETSTRQSTPYVPPEPEEELDADAVKAAARVATRALQPVNGALASMQQQLDAMSFRNTVLEAGVEPEVAQAAGQQFNNWRKNGTRITDASGQERMPTAQDALAFALGRQMLEANKTAAPGRNLEALRKSLGGALGVEAGGSVAPRKASGLADIDKLPLQDRLKKMEQALGDVEL